MASPAVAARPRRRKTAADRRQQYCRAHARTLCRVVKLMASLDHRGSQPTRAAMELVSSLQSSVSFVSENYGPGSSCFRADAPTFSPAPSASSPADLEYSGGVSVPTMVKPTCYTVDEPNVFPHDAPMEPQSSSMSSSGYASSRLDSGSFGVVRRRLCRKTSLSPSVMFDLGYLSQASSASMQHSLPAPSQSSALSSFTSSEHSLDLYACRQASCHRYRFCITGKAPEIPGARQVSASSSCRPFTWIQSPEDVTIFVSVMSSTVVNDFALSFTAFSLNVSFGQTCVISGELVHRIRSCEHWIVPKESMSLLCIRVSKWTKNNSWPSMFCRFDADC